MIRFRLPDGSATDVIGWIEEPSPTVLRVRIDPGTTTLIQRSTIIVARRAPAAAGGKDPRWIPADVVEHHILPAWLAESEPLGQWTLRAGAGLTGRASSCSAIGDPGRAVPDAAAAIESWSVRHSIPACARVIVGSEPDLALSAIGWQETRAAAEVLVARLGVFLGTDLASPDVRVTEDLSPDWLSAYDRSNPNQTDPAALRQILAGNPPRAFASVGSPGHLAIARGHVSGDWLGLASIWVDSAHRRKGLAAAMMRALGHWAARLGARYVYVQIAASDKAALAAYEHLGFARHHTCRYLCPPPPGEQTVQ